MELILCLLALLLMLKAVCAAQIRKNDMDAEADEFMRKIQEDRQYVPTASNGS